MIKYTHRQKKLNVHELVINEKIDNEPFNVIMNGFLSYYLIVYIFRTNLILKVNDEVQV